MKPKVIRVKILRGEQLYFADSADMPSLKLANPERAKLIEEIVAVIKYAYESDNQHVKVEEAESDDPQFVNWIVTERLQEACG